MVEGNNGCMWVMKLSSNGKFLATSEESKVFVWNIKKERLKAVFRYKAYILGIEFYKDENEFLVLIKDGSVFLEDLKTKKRTIFAHFQTVSNINNFGVTFNMESLINIEALAEISLYDIKNGVHYKSESLTDKYIKALKACKNSKNIFFSIISEIKCWDIEEKCIRFTLEGHSRAINCLALSKNEEKLISTSYDSTLIIWDLLTQQKLFQSAPIHLTIYSAIWSNSQKYYISCEKTIKIWESNTHSLTSTLICDSGIVISLAITPNDSILILGTNVGSIELWDFELKIKIKNLKNDLNVKKILFLNEFNNFLTLGSNGAVSFWSVKEKKIVTRIEPLIYFREISKFDFKKVAMIKGNNSIEIFNIEGWAKVNKIDTKIEFLKLMRNLVGETFVTCGNNEVHFWLNKKKPFYSKKSNLHEINSISLTKKERFFVLCQINSGCEVWINILK